jgi:mannose-1-phosphate guanylyltransferase/mannose-6-phosphate isomerase
VNGFAGVTAAIVVTNNEQRFIVAEHLLEAGTVPPSIVLEPVGRTLLWRRIATARRM